eukprot:2287192-Pyramimonas_sp.AAC.1
MVMCAPSAVRPADLHKQVSDSFRIVESGEPLRKLSLTCLWRSAGRTAEVTHITMDGMRWDPKTLKELL